MMFSIRSLRTSVFNKSLPAIEKVFQLYTCPVVKTSGSHYLSYKTINEQIHPYINILRKKEDEK